MRPSEKIFFSTFIISISRKVQVCNIILRLLVTIYCKFLKMDVHTILSTIILLFMHGMFDFYIILIRHLNNFSKYLNENNAIFTYLAN